jgi:hypothetical protein
MDYIYSSKKALFRTFNVLLLNGPPALPFKAPFRFRPHHQGEYDADRSAWKWYFVWTNINSSLVIRYRNELIPDILKSPKA